MSESQVLARTWSHVHAPIRPLVHPHKHLSRVTCAGRFSQVKSSTPRLHPAMILPATLPTQTSFPPFTHAQPPRCGDTQQEVSCSHVRRNCPFLLHLPDLLCSSSVNKATIHLPSCSFHISNYSPSLTDFLPKYSSVGVFLGLSNHPLGLNPASLG